MELIHQKNEHPEEQEVKLEEGEKGKPNHTKYHKRGKRKSKKRIVKAVTISKETVRT